MKTQTLRLSLIGIAVIATIGVTTMTLLSLQNNIEKQNQEEKIEARVHVLTDNGIKYVKINDLVPNSSVIFVYPYTGNKTLDENAHNLWVLIRLPTHNETNNDGIFSFRAYSIVDIQLNCIVKYWPNHQWLEDPCHGSMYEPVYGIPFAGPAMNYQFKDNALPQLDLGLDNEGYIYVKPPIFDIDKNGVVGYGRKVPSDIFEKYVQLGQLHLQQVIRQN